MEACWVNAILIGIAGSGATLLPFWATFVLLIGSYWLAHSLIYVDNVHEAGTKGSGHRLRVPLGIALFIAVSIFSLWSGTYSATGAFWNPLWLGQLISDLLLLQPGAFRSLSLVAVVLYFFWRGTRLAHAVLEPGYVLMAMRIGFGVIVAVICLQFIAHSTSPQEVLLFLLLPLFLLFSLAAHALAKSSFMRSTHQSNFQGSVAMQERAILSMTAGFGGMLFLLTLLVSVFARSTFLGAIQQLATQVLILYDNLAIAVAFIMALIATPIIGLLSLFHFKLNKTPQQINTHQTLCAEYPSAAQCKVSVIGHTSYDPLLQLSTRVLLPLLILTLIVLLVLLLRRRRRRSIRRTVAETHESLWSWALLWLQIRAILQSFWRRLFPVLAVDMHIPEGNSEVTNGPTARSIREVYRALLAWAAQRGYPRKRGETPFEFRTRLRQHMPFSTPEVDIVTEAYTAIRYGRVVPSEEEVLYVQQMWQRLQDKQ